MAYRRAMAWVTSAHPRRRRTGRLVPPLVALVLLLGACGVVKGFVATLADLEQAGFNAPGINQVGDETVVTVEKDAEDLDAAAADAAEVVWDRLPLRIERMDVTCDNGYGGSGTFVAQRSELEQRFGTRDPALDRGFQESDFRTVGLVVLGLVFGGLVVLAGILVLILVLVRRSRRRNQPPGPPGPPGAWGQVPPPPGYGPSP